MGSRCLLSSGKRIIHIGVRLRYSTFSKRLQYVKCCKILEVTENSDQEEIRTAYLRLVKKYHPDSGTKEANADKFAEIDKAFKTLMHKKSEERLDGSESEVEEQDIKHTAPQHRQYLSYGGIGTGTPYQREKQYAKIRAMQAAENVLQHRISKLAAEEAAVLDKTTPVKHKIKTKYGFERLVEDLIQESMSKGEFSNLPGSGKPLPDHHNYNPYVDFITHKLNEVLIDNGFTPEWITLQKEILEEIRDLRKCLLSERGYFGRHPLNPQEKVQWDDIVDKYTSTSDQINKKINKFNLVVPILQKQMVQVNLDKEAEKAVITGKHNGQIKHMKRREDTVPSTDSDKKSENLFGFIQHLFIKK